RGEAFIDKDMKPHWNTRPAPVATDTVSKDDCKSDGLETFSVEVTSSGHPYMKSDPDGDYVTRSQAESEIRKVRKDAKELLAAERAKYRDAMEKLVASQRETLVWQNRSIELKIETAALTERIK